VRIVGIVNITEDSLSDGGVPDNGRRSCCDRRYVGRQARSGATLDASALHLWTVVDGVITGYRGFADTYALREATSQ
jgi:ketosteroid isomerase-like protein